MATPGLQHWFSLGVMVHMGLIPSNDHCCGTRELSFNATNTARQREVEAGRRCGLYSPREDHKGNEPQGVQGTVVSNLRAGRKVVAGPHSYPPFHQDQRQGQREG